MEDKKIERYEEEIKKYKIETKIAKIKFAMILLLLFAEVIAIGLFASWPFIKEKIEKSSKGGYVAVFDIDKTITERYVDRIIERIEKDKKENAKGFLFLFNTPGGSPSASAELSEYIKDLNKTYPVYGFVQSSALSGGYYIASAIKPLNANPNALIGSIGVILPHYDLSKLGKKLGIKESSVTAGKYKQPFSYLKPLTEENERYLRKNILLPVYENFLNDVAKNRGLSKKEIKKYAEGKIFVAGDERIKNKLIDRITYLWKIKNEIRERLGKSILFIEENLEERRPTLFSKSDFAAFLDAFLKNVEQETKLR